MFAERRGGWWIRTGATVTLGLLLPILAGNGLSDTTSRPPSAEASALLFPDDGYLSKTYSPEEVTQVPSLVIEGIIAGVSRVKQQDWLLCEITDHFRTQLAELNPNTIEWTQFLLEFVEAERFSPDFLQTVENNVGKTFQLRIPAILDPKEADAISTFIPQKATPLDSLRYLGKLNGELTSLGAADAEIYLHGLSTTDLVLTS